MRIATTCFAGPLCLAVCFALAAIVGCQDSPAGDGDRPAVLKPQPGTSATQVEQPQAASRGDRVLAEVGSVKVSESQILPALYESYGLDILLKVTQLDMARDAAASAGITVSPADVAAEKTLTLSLAFPDQKPDDYDTLLTQLLNQQRVSTAEFRILIETNANLRALVKPLATADVNEDAIHNEFNAVYGERVRVRHIALNNLQEVADARERLAGKSAEGARPAVPPEPFEKVAAEMSINRATAAVGGELPPFARTSGGYSPVFIQAAFALKPGETSTDTIQENRFYHILKVIERIPPQAVKFEDVHDSVREELIRRRQQNLMNLRRGEMAQAAIRNFKINEPILKEQFDKRLAAANPKPSEKDEVRRNLDEQRERLNEPTMTPTTTPAASSSTQPTTSPVAG